MEKINLNNYELYFIDYIDNKLSNSDMLELMAFLAENPILEKELNLAKEIKLEPELIIFSKKDILKKKLNEITNDKFNELCISKIENNITLNDEVLLNKQLKIYPELEKEFNLFKLTLLKPDNSIVFSNKSALKRKNIYSFSKTFLKVSSIAVAVVILFLIIIKGFNFDNNDNKKSYANSKQVVKTNNIINKIPIQIKPNKKFFVLKKQIKKHNSVKINTSLLVNDTSSIIAFENKIKNIDSNVVNNNDFNLYQENKFNNLAVINNSKHNNYLDTTLNAVFENSKYSHFRDMINNVPYESITASNNGNFAMWDIIKAGTNGINYITGSQITVDNKVDEKKQVKRFSIKIGKLGFSRIVHK